MNSRISPTSVFFVCFLFLFFPFTLLFSANDQDLDGVDDELEAFLGSNPQVADQPQSRIYAAAVGEYAVLNYTESKDPGRPGWQVSWSTNLIDWSTTEIWPTVMDSSPSNHKDMQLLLHRPGVDQVFFKFETTPDRRAVETQFPLTIPSSFYNAHLTHGQSPGWFPGAFDLSALPMGRQKFKNVTWQLAPDQQGPAAVMLRGAGSSVTTSEVLNIPLNITADGLWILHTYNQGSVGNGSDTPVGQYVVHLEDGTSYPFNIEFDNGIHHWIQTASEVTDLEHLDPKGSFKMIDSAPIWTNQEENSGSQRHTVLHASRWHCPKPMSALKSIDFIAPSDPALGAPVLLAITAIREARVEVDGESWIFRDFGHAAEDVGIAYDPANGQFTIPFYSNKHASQLVYREKPVEGDFVFQAKLNYVNVGGSYLYPALTVRDKPMGNYIQLGANNGATEVAVFVRPTGRTDGENGPLFWDPVSWPIDGDVAIGSSSFFTGTKKSGIKIPCFVRLVRSGNTFSGYYSESGADGTWELIGTENKSIPNAAYVSFNQSGAHSEQVNYAIWEQISVTDSSAPVAPTVNSHPRDLQVTFGGEAEFSVSASGSATLNYQWYKNGNPLPGENGSVLLLSNVQPGDAGSYTVRVQNGVDFVISDPAVLTVNGLAVSVSGSDVSLDWVDFSHPDFTQYRVERAGQLIAGNVGFSAYTDNGVPDGSYLYRVVAYDAVGGTELASWSAQATVDTSGPVQLFSDDFSDGNFDGWTATGGTWSVDGGWLKQADNVDTTTLRLNQGNGWSDYTLALDIRAEEDTPDWIGVRVYFQDANNYVEFRMTSEFEGPRRELVQVVGGVESVLDPGDTVLYEKDTTYALEVEVDAGTVRVRLDGSEILSGTTSLNSGTIGLMNKYTANAMYDNIEVAAGEF